MVQKCEELSSTLKSRGYLARVSVIFITGLIDSRYFLCVIIQNNILFATHHLTAKNQFIFIKDSTKLVNDFISHFHSLMILGFAVNQWRLGPNQNPMHGYLYLLFQIRIQIHPRIACQSWNPYILATLLKYSSVDEIAEKNRKLYL